MNVSAVNRAGALHVHRAKERFFTEYQVNIYEGRTFSRRQFEWIPTNVEIHGDRNTFGTDLVFRDGDAIVAVRDLRRPVGAFRRASHL